MTSEHVVRPWWRVNRAAPLALVGASTAAICFALALVALSTGDVFVSWCGRSGSVHMLDRLGGIPAVLAAAGIPAALVAAVAGVFGSALRPGRRVAQWSSVLGALLVLALVAVLLYLPIFMIVYMIC